MIDVTYQQVERHADALVLATTPDDIRRAKADGKVAVLMGIEGGHAIENSLNALRDFYRLGVRYMTLTSTASTTTGPIRPRCLASIPSRCITA